MKISVCLVTCNGELFIERQLKSIFSQTLLPDEIVLVDDFSDDNTVIIVQKILAQSGIRHTIIRNHNRLGINKSFEKCLSCALFDIIVISDQDDFWLDDRLLVIQNSFLKHPCSELVLVNAYIERNGVATEETISNYYPYTKSIFLNFIKNRFTGCQMSIKRSLVERLLPFPPDFVCYYDHWLSLFALFRKTTTYIGLGQGYYCRHSSNVTGLSSPRSFFRVVASRATMFIFILKKYISGKFYKM